MGKATKKYTMGGGFTYGDGDMATDPRQDNMKAMAAGGGLKGFTNGGGVMDGMIEKKAYGGNAGDISRSSSRDYSKK
jgi:hypothetical protein|tara:strand:- start:1076 stop:1306 length:231 start_codon:yes stop_codon:yes gene_type:complete